MSLFHFYAEQNIHAEYHGVCMIQNSVLSDLLGWSWPPEPAARSMSAVH